MATQFTLPELGENLESGVVVQVLVKPGDTVAVDQPVLELETDKATVEVPSGVAGVIRDVAVAKGDTLAVGQTILTVADGDGAVASAGGHAAGDSASGTDATRPTAKPAGRAETADAGATGEDEHGANAAPAADAGTPKPQPTDDARPPAATTHPTPPPSTRPVLAAPSVRRLATEIGVDIARVPGSGARGRVTLDDVKAYARQTRETAAAGAAPGGAAPPELPDFSKWGEVRREPMSGIRRATAAQMARAWQAPHVTQHDKTDLTQFQAVRAKLKADKSDLPLTVTAFAVKVAAAALRAFPQFNASIDLARNEVVYKEYVHIGVAVDTERGLLVPVLRDADEKPLPQIAREIVELAERARTKRVTPDDLAGGSFTITNLGGIGGTAFTPIVNYPEAAILGLARSRVEPVYRGDSFEPRPMLPLSLSYDHRLIDGADAARFLRWVADRLEQPLLLSV